MTAEQPSEAQLTRFLREHGELVTERLAHHAAATPEKVFFYYGEDDLTLTYGEFARRTDAIAGNLVRLGVHRGERVSVFTRSPLAGTLMMFGIWKAGAVYSPVNFAYSGRLLTYQMTDSAPRLVVTDASLLPVLNDVADTLQAPPPVVIYSPPEGSHDFLPSAERPMSRYDEIAWEELTRECAAPSIALGFDDPANLIYTSGTTGPAKGVVQPHRWMATYTFGLRVLLTPEDVIYNDLPVYHVGGAIANICRAAFVGCEVAVWDRFSPERFWSRIAARGVTTAILLDVMIPWLTAAPKSGDDRRNSLNKVHMQPLALQHSVFAQRFGIDFVTAGFGQTESGLAMWTVIEETAQGEGTPPELYRGALHATIHAQAARFGMSVTSGDEATRKGLMGMPTPFVEAVVRNDDDEECEPEIAGQLTLRPRLPGMFMHAYLGKPEATLSAFRNLWFHTGDAAVKAADGRFYFVDRLGDRIRVRGENLSSFQVEDMINQHPQVQMSAAVAVRSREGDEDEIAVFVVPAEGAGIDEAEIRDFAGRTMPKYMRPSHVRVVADLPKTPTNKIEKYRLRQQILAEIG